MRKTYSIFSILVFLSFIVLVNYGGSFLESRDLKNTKKKKEENIEVSGIEKTKYRVLNKVLRVIDGDSIIVEVDGLQQRVRLIGVDTPETVDPRRKVECFGKESSDFLKTLLENKSVYMETDTSQGDKDKYERLLRYVYLNDLLVNKEIIEKGFGYEYTYNLPYKYQKEFKEAQKNARENKVGLWVDGICE